MLLPTQLFLSQNALAGQLLVWQKAKMLMREGLNYLALYRFLPSNTYDSGIIVVASQPVT